MLEVLSDVYRNNLLAFSVTGSHLYGLNTEDSDQDYFGIFVEPLASLVGFAKMKSTIQFKDEAGSKEAVLHALKHWVTLAALGNPTVISILFAPQEMIKAKHPLWDSFVKMRSGFASQQSKKAFRGYLIDQRHRLEKNETYYQSANRIGIVEKYGFDTKYAMHMVRVGLNAVEFLTTGKITFPMQGANRQLLMDIRTGKYTKNQTVGFSKDLESRLDNINDLPYSANTLLLEELVMDTYKSFWGMLQ